MRSIWRISNEETEVINRLHIRFLQISNSLEW